MIKEFIFNNKGSYSDFGLILNYFKPQPPSPKVIEDEVPFVNGVYDFSTVATNGEIVYTERKILCSLQFKSGSKIDLYTKYSQILSWLLDSGKQQLISPYATDIYYNSRVKTAPSWDTFANSGKLEFEFISEPFAYGKDLVGQEQWDNINFETFKFQDTTFTVNGTQILSVYNEGRKVVPTVIVSSNMTCTVNGYTKTFTTAVNKDWSFYLMPENNAVTVTGNGIIQFQFRKEVM